MPAPAPTTAPIHPARTPTRASRSRRHRRAGVALLLLASLASLASLACTSAARTRAPALPPGAQAMSLLGRALFPPSLPDAERAIAAADSALAASSDDPDRLLAAAAARATAWRFNEAIALYTRGVERWPDDARFLRFRGHRYLTVRRFDDAVRDLDRAATLDSTNFDVVYHQGLAHFLRGDFARSAAAYDKCLGFAANEALRAREASGAYRRGYRSCMRMATDDDSRVAMADWAWRARMRAGRARDAEQLLEDVREGMQVNANRSYHENLLMYKGVRTPDEVMQAAGADSVRFSTSGFAVGHYHLVRGDSARGWALLERVASGSHWNGFGVIGAEAELHRRARR